MLLYFKLSFSSGSFIRLLGIITLYLKHPVMVVQAIIWTAGSRPPRDVSALMVAQVLLL